jgi:hypothetical protein
MLLLALVVLVVVQQLLAMHLFLEFCRLSVAVLEEMLALEVAVVQVAAVLTPMATPILAEQSYTTINPQFSLVTMEVGTRPQQTEILQTAAVAVVVLVLLVVLV